MLLYTLLLGAVNRIIIFLSKKRSKPLTMPFKMEFVAFYQLHVNFEIVISSWANNHFKVSYNQQIIHFPYDIILRKMTTLRVVEKSICVLLTLP